MFVTGEEQIAWVPENDKNTLSFVEKACSLLSFQARIDWASCKKKETLLKITVSIICEYKN